MLSVTKIEFFLCQRKPCMLPAHNSLVSLWDCFLLSTCVSLSVVLEMQVRSAFSASAVDRCPLAALWHFRSHNTFPGSPSLIGVLNLFPFCPLYIAWPLFRICFSMWILPQLSLYQNICLDFITRPCLQARSRRTETFVNFTYYCILDIQWPDLKQWLCVLVWFLLLW